MTNTIVLSEPDVDTFITTWTGLQLEKGANATQLNTFATLARIPYVADQTSYTYVDIPGVQSDWYRTCRYNPGGFVTYSAPWPVAVPPTSRVAPTRRSLRACRRMLGRRLQGSLNVVTTTADGAVGGNSLIATNLGNQLDANRFRQWWVMPVDGANAGLVRHVSDQALNPVTGELQVGPPFPTRVASGTQVELSRLLPPYEMDGHLGLKECLNLALAECWVLDRLQLAGLSNTAVYTLDYGDWLDPEAIHEFYGPYVDPSWVEAPWSGWNARRDGQQILLDTPGDIAGGTRMDLSLTRPADTLMKHCGVWTDNCQGFELDDDESLIQPQFLVQVALAHAYEALAGMTTGAVSNRMGLKAQDQRIIANRAKYVGLPHPKERADHRAQSGALDQWWTWVR